MRCPLSRSARTSAEFAVDRKFNELAATFGESYDPPLSIEKSQVAADAARGAALTAAVILGTTALVVARHARRAERNNPPVGRFLDIGGVRLHYLEGPPLVLLHGNGAMVQDFEISGILEWLVQRYRVIAGDRPGFGGVPAD